MDGIAGVAALNEPVRHALYRYVAAQSESVTREQVAAGTGVPAHVAKFHLDRLASAGLLTVTWSRPAGRRGPGAGRPAKLYRRADHEISVTLPPRQYELAGQILADAITLAEATNRPVAEALADAAHRAGKHTATARGTQDLLAVLDACGFEPRDADDFITLSNCPFHRLAATHAALVCGLNLHYLRGVLDGLGHDQFAAHLTPSTGQCCVSIQRASPRRTQTPRRAQA